jgi:hypothetical protein
MGKGLAKQFATAYSGLRARHANACMAGDLHIGKTYLVRNAIRASRRDFGDELSHTDNDRLDNILLFPTKDRWQDPSEYRWIFQGLSHLYDTLLSYDISPSPGIVYHIAMPALGCGLGGLHYSDVFELIKYWCVGLDERFMVTIFDR